MNGNLSDALVFFGATGDLAYKKIFPALQSMLKRGHLNVPVIAVAKENWSLDQLRARAHDSLAQHGAVDPAAFEKLSGLLRYVGGDYSAACHLSGAAQSAGWVQAAGALSRDTAAAVRHVVEQLANSGSAGTRASSWRSRSAATWLRRENSTVRC